MSELMLEIGKLTLRDRLALVQEILATIAAEAEPSAGLELSESEILELTRRYPSASRRLVATRPLLAHALSGQKAALEQALVAEESAERELDRSYWLPLRTEL